MFLLDKLNRSAEILILSYAVDFITKSLRMRYSVVTAQKGCSREMVKGGGVGGGGRNTKHYTLCCFVILDLIIYICDDSLVDGNKNQLDHFKFFVTR